MPKQKQDYDSCPYLVNGFITILQFVSHIEANNYEKVTLYTTNIDRPCFVHHRLLQNGQNTRSQPSIGQ
ncbi:hypothetical protein Hanom_Chr12g01091071 [Helianthus anomalus]